jgi:hypothetical protein
VQTTGHTHTHTQDAELDSLGTKLISELLATEPDLTLPYLVNPSDAFSAVFNLWWHYPAMATKYPFFGSVADNTNPHLRMGIKRLALESRQEVLMTEHFSARVTKVNRKDASPYLKQDRCVQILVMGRVLLLLERKTTATSAIHLHLHVHAPLPLA